jgi:hypothetical protein
MSRWLSRALAEREIEAPVPIVPLAPIARSSGAIGTNGTIGTPAVDPSDWQAAFQERAAIREFEGGFPRHEAERLARQDLKKSDGRAPR